MDKLSQIVIKGCLVLFLGFIVLTPKLSAQDVTVSGNVYDSETNDVLAGVNIFVKGTNIGTSSDASGNFIENVTSSSDTLIFCISVMKRGRYRLMAEQRLVWDCSLR